MADAAKPAAEEKKPEEGEKKPEEGAEGEKKDGEKKEGAEGEKKKCVGKAECPKPPVNFSGPKQGLDGMKKKLDDTVQNGIKTIGTAAIAKALRTSWSVGLASASRFSAKIIEIPTIIAIFANSAG